MDTYIFTIAVLKMLATESMSHDDSSTVFQDWHNLLPEFLVQINYN